MSGMLLTTSCDSNNNQTADYENEVEAVENEPLELERENVREDVAEMEMETETEETPPAPETTTTTNQTAQNQQASSDRSARSMPNMDSHIEEYKEPNQAIREELTDATDEVGQDATMGTQGMDRQNVTNTQTGTDYQQTDDMNRQNTSDEYNLEEDTNRTAEVEDLSETGEVNTTQDQQGRENVANTEADRMEQEAVIISLYEIDLERLSEEDRQRMNELMNEYKERRERERGQMNPETGAYVSPDMDARPTQGYEELMNTVTDKITYPQNALAAEMEGTVVVNFIVNERGEVTNAQALESIIVPTAEMQYTQPLNPTKFSEQEVEETKKEMMEEAVKAVENTSGQWEAAMMNGEAVPAELQLPIHFRIPSSDTIIDGE